LELQTEEMEGDERAKTAVSDLAPLRLSGYFRQEAAFRMSAPRQLSKFRSVGYSALTGQYTEALSYKIAGRLWYDAVYDLTHHYPESVADDQKVDGMLRDAYVDFSKDNWDLRAGKQQIVWGESVGLFYADVVNAKDLREFILPDFEFIRIPEWALDAEYTKSNFHAEAVWLPWPSMSKVSRPGGEFVFPLPLPPATPIAFGPARKPGKDLDDGEAGARLSYRVEGWDVGAFVLRTWEKLPVLQRTLSPGLATFTETHPRLTIDGLTFAKELEPFVLKGEWIYTARKNFQSKDLADADGLKTKDVMDYMLGADYTFPNNLETTLQLGQRYIRAYENDLFQQRKLQTQLTLWVRRAFWANRLSPEFLLVKDLGTTDLMARPKVTYKFLDHWKCTLGADVFAGPAEGLFGAFAARDRLYTELQFDF